MSNVDWIVMSGFIGFVVLYGTWKSRNVNDVDAYLRAGRTSKWWLVALSIMATQASAITFLSTPGQAYVDGMRFVQFYLGLPIDMIILSITAVPIYNKLNVYTAYEYLEKRFDLKNRMLGSALFLTQRGLAAGFTIYAPSLILSVILGWEINFTIIIMGAMVILYTTVGGTVAVNKTHFLQMIIIAVGMFAAFYVLMSVPPSMYSAPTPDCGDAAAFDNDDFDDNLEPGLYRLSGDINLNGGELWGEGVTLYIIDGSLSINGNVEVHLTAPPRSPDPAPAIPGMLILFPPTNSNELRINGNAGNYFQGTILAPASDIIFEGTADSDIQRAQIIGYNVQEGGNAKLNVLFDENLTYSKPTFLELFK